MEISKASEIGERTHFIRGQTVLLDFTLAAFYDIETKALKRSVRRNITRFPNDFMFELTKRENELIRCQLGTTMFKKYGHQNKLSTSGGSRTLPFAFTEAGVSMLSSVLRSERAIQINIEIMRAFAQIRHGIKTSTEPIANLAALQSLLEGQESKLDRILTHVQTLAGSSSQSKQKHRDTPFVQAPDPAIEAIQKAVAEHYGLELEALKTDIRKKAIVKPRHIAMYLIRKYLGTGFKDIGDSFGGRDHTTVIHACEKVETDRATDRITRDALAYFQSLFRSNS